MPTSEPKGCSCRSWHQSGTEHGARPRSGEPYWSKPRARWSDSSKAWQVPDVMGPKMKHISGLFATLALLAVTIIADMGCGAARPDYESRPRGIYDGCVILDISPSTRAARSRYAGAIMRF